MSESAATDEVPASSIEYLAPEEEQSPLIPRPRRVNLKNLREILLPQIGSLDLELVLRLVTALKRESILDLLPASFAFGESAEPVTFAGSAVSESQKAQLEHFVRLAGKR